MSKVSLLFPCFLWNILLLFPNFSIDVHLKKAFVWLNIIYNNWILVQKVLINELKVTRVEAKRRLSSENILPAKDKLNTIKLRIASAVESREAKIVALQQRLRDHVLA